MDCRIYWTEPFTAQQYLPEFLDFRRAFWTRHPRPTVPRSVSRKAMTKGLRTSLGSIGASVVEPRTSK